MSTTIFEAHSHWEGNISDGSGRVDLGVDLNSGQFSVDSRCGRGTGVDPERLIAGAQASCYAMALASQLAEEGYTPSQLAVASRVFLERQRGKAFIPTLELIAEARVDNLNGEAFKKLADTALKRCPIVNLCSGAEIVLKAHHRAS